MELQTILNLINQRKFEEAKKNLIELLGKKKKKRKQEFIEP